MPTIQKRGDTYRIRVSAGYDSSGKQIMKSTTWKPAPGMTQKQIQKELDRQAVLFEERVKTGQYMDGNIKLDDFVKQWFSDYADKNMKPATLSLYHLLMRRVSPALGHIRMDRLRPNHLLQFYNQLENVENLNTLSYIAMPGLEKAVNGSGMTKARLCELAGVGVATLRAAQAGKAVSRESASRIAQALHVPLKEAFAPSGHNRKLSKSTIAHYHRFLSAVFSSAVEWQVIRENPCARVKPPKEERKNVHYLDEKQAAIFLDALQGQPFQYRAMVTTLLYSGMRRGELCGLEWEDVDFQNDLINIRRNAVYIPGKGIEDGTTKTENSERVMKLPPVVMEVLAEQRRKQAKQRLLMGDRWNDSRKVFTQPNGKPIRMDTLSKWIKQFSVNLGLPPVTAHSLRHTNATLLIACGANIRTVAGRLGHASPSTTGNIYSHAIKTADEIASDMLDDMLKPKGSRQA